MSEQPTAPQSLLWYTDTSRLSEGLGHCQRSRFLGNHFGPASVGIRRLARNVPLATGQHVHWGCEQLATFAMDNDAAPPRDLVVDTAREAAARYLADIDRFGIAYWGDSLNDLITEQSTFIAGCVYVYGAYRLPELLRTHQVVLVEYEQPVIIAGCSCGLGNQLGFHADHVARGCTGIALQTRADMVVKSRDTGTLTYRESKTQGVDAIEIIQDKWTTRVQMAVATLGAEQKLGAPVESVTIEVFLKGRRLKSTRTNAQGQPEEHEYQSSPLSWAWRKPANPPVEPEDWQCSYEWTELESGRKRRLGKGYDRTLTAYYNPEDPILGVIAFVDEVVAPAGLLRKVCGEIGPLPRHEVVRDSAIRSFGYEEQRWQRIVWELYEIHQRVGSWTHPEYLDALDRLAPQSWECRKFGGRHACQFEPICFRTPGWEDPIAHLGFGLRTPHHAPERKQFEAMRVVFPEAVEDDDGD